MLVATDARRREVYWAVYDDGARVDRAVGVQARRSRCCRPACVAAAGDGARLYARRARPAGARPAALYPPAAALAALAADRVLRRAPSEPLTPLYLRRPDAVEPAARKPCRQ